MRRGRGVAVLVGVIGGAALGLVAHTLLYLLGLNLGVWDEGDSDLSALSLLVLGAGVGGRVGFVVARDGN